jgi:DNA-binding Xre family transcriptional regulator
MENSKEELEEVVVDSQTPEKPFHLQSNGEIIFNEGFIISDEIVERSKMMFETPLLKPYVSKFIRASNKNISMANILKLCVLLQCSPNDLFNWEDWTAEIYARMATKDGYLITHDDIKEIL